MAKPDLEDGYLRIAHELFAALACAGFNKWEWVVIREVLDQIYGPRKRKLATLSPTEVASRAGTYKESIVRAIRSLKDSGVLKEAEHGLQFVKNYEAWNWSGNPRLSPSEQIYCHAAKTVNTSTKRGNESAPVTSTKQGNESAPISTITGNESAPNGERIGSPAGTKALPDGNESAPRAHYVERGSGELIEKGRKGEWHTPTEFETGKKGPEHDKFIEAWKTLKDHAKTSHLAVMLTMAADTPEIRGFPSWKIWVGAIVAQRPNKSEDWNSFLGFCRNATEAEYRRLQKSPSVNGEAKHQPLEYFTGSPEMLGPPGVTK